MSPSEIRTKPEAVAFVSYVLSYGMLIHSPDFHVAMDLSREFDVSARDVLEFRRRSTR